MPLICRRSFPSEVGISKLLSIFVILAFSGNSWSAIAIGHEVIEGGKPDAKEGVFTSISDHQPRFNKWRHTLSIKLYCAGHKKKNRVAFAGREATVELESKKVSPGKLDSVTDKQGLASVAFFSDEKVHSKFTVSTGAFVAHGNLDKGPFAFKIPGDVCDSAAKVKQAY